MNNIFVVISDRKKFGQSSVTGGKYCFNKLTTVHHIMWLILQVSHDHPVVPYHDRTEELQNH